MKVKTAKLRFNDVEFSKQDIPKLRGYFANKFSEIKELHNHLPGGKFSYNFPKIQYRMINRNPAVIAIDDGIEILKKLFFTTDELKIGRRKFSVIEKEIEVIETEIQQTDEIYEYRFASPWMALNQKNYKKYKNKTKFQQQIFLKTLLKHNLLTISKGLDYTIPDFDKISVEGYFEPYKVGFKNHAMLCFFGNFAVNFKIPELLGLGKQTARGFGIPKLIHS